MKRDGLIRKLFRKIGSFFKKLFIMILNPHFLICFGIAWIITNGWSYAFLGIGIWTGTTWMTMVATGYLAFLWLPGTPEKIATCAIAIFLLRLIFPHDEKTLGTVKELFQGAKEDIRRRKVRRRAKRIEQFRRKAIKQAEKEQQKAAIDQSRAERDGHGEES
ncbi:MAG: hypothetical protein IJT60_00250 [Clostridia bacterium]|nr:hypothetical protein [Clostridia bacterium]